MMADFNWSDAQWQKVNDAVHETHRDASVASKFLPTYGPLTGSAEIVRNERLQELDFSTRPPTIRLDRDYEGVNVRLVNLAVTVELSSEQVADETLTNALLMFRRAASILAQEQDRVVFEGLRRRPRSDDSKFVTNADIEPQRGLADLPSRWGKFTRFTPEPGETIGQAVIRQIEEATGALADKHNPGPFACVLGGHLYTKVNSPTPSLVLPADRIAPLLKSEFKSGWLERGTTMQRDVGIVVSLGNGAVDLVVGTPPTVQFLQRTSDAKFLFRVYERFALRIRDIKNRPVAGFRLDDAAAIATEQTELQLAEIESGRRLDP
jgi:uncharacterized linocin/CFP29 family protein